MIDPVQFFIGVLAGQLSLILAFAFAKLVKPLISQRYYGATKAAPSGKHCPRCKSTKLAETEIENTLWCEKCGYEHKNGEPSTANK